MNHKMKFLLMFFIIGLAYSLDLHTASAAPSIQIESAMVTTDFTNGSEYPGEYVVGTGMWFNIGRLETITPVSQLIVIRQSTQLQDGTSGVNDWNLAGVYNSGTTSDGIYEARHQNLIRYFWMVKAGTYFDSDTFGSRSWDWRRSGTPLTSAIRFRRQFKNVCISQGQGSIGCSPSYVKWEFQRCDLGTTCKEAKINLRLGSKSPVRILNAHHGGQSADLDNRNDLHARTWEHHYNGRPVCGGHETYNCYGEWDSSDEEGWATYSTLMTEAPEFLIYEPSVGTTADNEYHLCLGKSPGTRCGCEVCEDWAGDITHGPYKWEPDKSFPLNVYVDTSTMPSGISWVGITDDAIAYWNSHFSDSIPGRVLRRTLDPESADIILHGDDLPFGSFASGNNPLWDETGHTESYESWNCSLSPDPTTYVQLDQRKFGFSTSEWSIWSEDNKITTPDMRPWTTFPTWEMSADFVVTHELGHAIAVGHIGACPELPEYPTPGPGPTATATAGPTSTPLAFPLMCSPPANEYFSNVLIGIEWSEDIKEAIECAFHMR